MFNPVSTYRVQFHKDFKFQHLQEQVGYFKALGIRTIYASPIFEAVPGSMHGYDIIHPLKINPEIGTEEEFRQLVSALKEAGINWIQDIVPNHMAFDHRNEWLMDVLGNGKNSAYASWFDIDWQHPVYPGKLMLPVLTTSSEEAIASGSLKLGYENGEFVLVSGNAFFPVKAHERYAVPDPQAYLQQVNSDAALLRSIVDEQNYRFCHNRKTNLHINYRRFFTINGLICLNVQNEDVFAQTHRLIKAWVDEALIEGVRVDHIDGLYDPSGYLINLRKLLGEHAYIVVEKILQPGEELPSHWPVQGSTGYDFLGLVNNLLASNRTERQFTRYYHKLIRQRVSAEKEMHKKKALILRQYMQGELENLHRLFLSLHPQAGDVKIKEAIAQFLVYCPVYRYYGNAFPLPEKERQQIASLLHRIATEQPALEDAIRVLETVLLQIPLENNHEINLQIAHFYRRCMQLAGPLMAKGVEDTLMYTYNRMIAHNDVGDHPSSFGIAVDDFHEAMIRRQEYSPLTMNTTSTHDTKRGEDSRARANVLTEIFEEWKDSVETWRQLNAPERISDMPDVNDEYFIYQALVGAYPAGIDHDFGERLISYMQKVVREAKTHSSWEEHDEDYEKATAEFIHSLLREAAPFRESFIAFQKYIAERGVINSLTQLVLKYTCPGIPDLYQGAELWDLSFVDPDNRRAVDFDLRLRFLNEQVSLNELWSGKRYEQVKLKLTQALLHLRAQYAEVFEKGTYIPLQVKGTYKDHIAAFARRYRHTWIITAVPLHMASLWKEDLHFDWKDTAVILPPEASGQYEDCFTGSKYKGSRLELNALFGSLPFGICVSVPSTNKRGAGVLMHITSLPSAYGIGDLGPEARKFAGFLSRSRQQYWQVLPLNPIKEHSPYSARSAMAGNILLISPDDLLRDGLLHENELEFLPQTDTVSFEETEKVKQALLHKAYLHFLEGPFDAMRMELENFIAREQYWLDDYALYAAIKQQQGEKAWYEWETGYRLRDRESINRFAVEHAPKMTEIKWQQYIFHKQWHALKAYCNTNGIMLFGDMPFYLSHDAADVWAHPDLFSLDEQKHMKVIAGVPPDYFSKTGQLWGMPTYNWNRLKENKYDWWIARLKKNFELFDLLRIDHFRAFAEYWEVPAGSETAENGEWKSGPGKDFFITAQEVLGDLALVAEDLGENMEKVYALREELDLPGMKVLQYGFGKNFATAVDAPHQFTANSVAYTGTHDNNTIPGWYKNELDEPSRQRLSHYSGVKVNRKNVSRVLTRIAYASVAERVIIPLQDLLDLDADKRMNKPGTVEGNWLWRLLPGQIGPGLEKRLREWVEWYGRM